MRSWASTALAACSSSRPRPVPALSPAARCAPSWSSPASTNVLTKSLGTNNAMNIVKAAAEGLKNMESPEQVAARRDTSVAKIYGWKEKE